MLNSFNAQGSSLAPTHLSRQQAKEMTLFATTAYSVAVQRGAQPPLPPPPSSPLPFFDVGSGQMEAWVETCSDHA